MSEGSKLSVQFTTGRKSKNCPFLVTFPSCAPKPEQLDPDNEDRVKFTPFAVNGCPSLLIAKTRRVGFAGIVQKTPTKFIVATFDKTKKVCSLLSEADTLPFQPFTKASNHGPNEALSNVDSSLQARMDLTDTFGTKKKQKEQRQAMANRVSGKMVAGLNELEEGLESATSHSTLSELPQGSTLLPHHNVNALTQSEAYPLAGVFGECLDSFEEEVVKSWRKTAKKPSELKKIDENKFGSYFVHNLEKTRLDGKAEQKNQIRLLLLYSALLQFNRLPSVIKKKREEIAEELEIPVNLVKELCFRFSSKEPGSRFLIRSKNEKTKLIFHLLVVALHIDGFRLFVDQIARDLRLPAVKYGIIR
uniref:Uncharacterized protein n=1 Tax=Palpitomonas bilix TaxID=652834 RepID=A0A7S3D4M3_9EUKA|mmetsp:Transcript_21453/g.55754  ORF Transcript_21453/g.55754 Transcript_21453/m.55754 type:complete len:361 (+) Transcript_21453:67-1149(+)